jgi:type II secretory pathway pseudopilin PulG
MQSWWRVAIVSAAVGSVLSAIAIPGFLSSQRASNERNASTSLKTLTSAEADFRANDRDRNGVNDFWTGDVSGLYSLTIDGTELRLIERSIAEADTCPIRGLCWPYVSRAGYFYSALEADDSVTDGDNTYFQDTGGNRRMGDVHHQTRFGFSAYPESARYGKYTFMVNENNTIFRVDTKARRITRWPDDSLLKVWSNL